jgi:hypothetical protein
MKVCAVFDQLWWRRVMWCVWWWRQRVAGPLQRCVLRAVMHPVACQQSHDPNVAERNTRQTAAAAAARCAMVWHACKLPAIPKLQASARASRQAGRQAGRQLTYAAQHSLGHTPSTAERLHHDRRSLAAGWAAPAGRGGARRGGQGEAQAVAGWPQRLRRRASAPTKPNHPDHTAAPTKPTSTHQ